MRETRGTGKRSVLRRCDLPPPPLPYASLSFSACVFVWVLHKTLVVSIDFQHIHCPYRFFALERFKHGGHNVFETNIHRKYITEIWPCIAAIRLLVVAGSDSALVVSGDGVRARHNSVGSRTFERHSFLVFVDSAGLPYSAGMCQPTIPAPYGTPTLLDIVPILVLL